MNESKLFESIIKKWEVEKRKYVKSSTYAFYLFEIKNYIIPVLGKKTPEEIMENELQKAVLYWQQEGGKNHMPLKKSTVQNLVTLTSQILKYAMKEGYSNKWLIDVHYLPKAYQKKQKVFSKKEQEKIVNAVLNQISYKSLGILFCLTSGLRIGELCALQWKDIDFSTGIVHITKTLQRIYNSNNTPKTQIIISSPKTSTSIRDIPLTKNMLYLIEKIGKKNLEGYILTNTPNYMEPRTFRKFYMQFLQENDIVPLNFHCLRHTFATRCIENGGDCKSVSEILGHATINTTLNMYVHPPMDEKRRCVELMSW